MSEQKPDKVRQALDRGCGTVVLMFFVMIMTALYTLRWSALKEAELRAAEEQATGSPSVQVGALPLLSPPATAGPACVEGDHRVFVHLGEEVRCLDGGRITALRFVDVNRSDRVEIRIGCVCPTVAERTP